MFAYLQRKIIVWLIIIWRWVFGLLINANPIFTLLQMASYVNSQTEPITTTNNKTVAQQKQKQQAERC